DRRPVREPVRPREQGAQVEPDRPGRGADGVDEAAREVAGRRGRLPDRGAAVLPHHGAIGERAADVDADAVAHAEASSPYRPVGRRATDGTSAPAPGGK